MEPTSELSNNSSNELIAYDPLSKLKFITDIIYKTTEHVDNVEPLYGFDNQSISGLAVILRECSEELEKIFNTI